MEKLNGIQFLNNLLAQEPSKIIDWIRNIREKREVLPQNFNWLGLAEGCLSRTYEDNNLLWARAAIDTYYLLAGIESNGDDYLLSIMRLRVYLINKLGAVDNDPILDFRQVVNRFFEKLTIPFSEVQKKVDIWTKLDIEQIKELRKIKNQLAIFNGLDTSLLNPYPELTEWMLIKDKLP